MINARGRLKDTTTQDYEYTAAVRDSQINGRFVAVAPVSGRVYVV